jgi:hypothetical protein
LTPAPVVEPLSAVVVAGFFFFFAFFSGADLLSVVVVFVVTVVVESVLGAGVDAPSPQPTLNIGNAAITPIVTSETNLRRRLIGQHPFQQCILEKIEFRLGRVYLTAPRTVVQRLVAEVETSVSALGGC